MEAGSREIRRMGGRRECVCRKATGGQAEEGFPRKMSLVHCCLNLSNFSLALAKESFRETIFESGFYLVISEYQSKNATTGPEKSCSLSFLMHLSNEQTCSHGMFRVATEGPKHPW